MGHVALMASIFQAISQNIHMAELFQMILGTSGVLDKDILLALFGAFVGAFLPVLFGMIWRSIVYIRLYLRDDGYRGTWYTYHFTTEDGNVVLREEQWLIKLSIFGGYRVSTTDFVRPRLRYVGRIHESGDCLLCNMKGLDFIEEYHVRIKRPIPSLQNRTYGLKVGVDFGNNVFASVYLYSRDRITDVLIAEKLIGDKFKAGWFDKFIRLV